MYTEDDLLPLSALTHFVFCPRRAALTRLEGVWAENKATAQGEVTHQNVHADPGSEIRAGVRIARGVSVRSFRLGLVGVLDVVEFHPVDGEMDCGAALHDLSGLWRPFPVEYKGGRLREEPSFAHQLCAQALCLEEMLGATVPDGAVYYGKTRRRLRIAFSAGLRAATEGAARGLHALMDSQRTPSPVYSRRCTSCSLKDACLPKVCGGRRRVRDYLRQAIEEA
ncbi:MAG: CRISPR-associated protein Cas4 [Solidesulfovibrio sp.]